MHCLQGGVCAVACNDFFVPCKRLFLFAGQRAAAVILLVYVNEAVPFAHLAGAHRNNVDGTPAGVADHRNVIQLNGLPQRINVTAQKTDAVIVLNAAIRLYGVDGTQTILHNEQRQFIPVIQLIQCDAQAVRIDGPIPVGTLEIRIAAFYTAIRIFRCTGN